LLGRSCSYLDSAHASRLRQLAAALGNTPPFDISAGLYSVVLNAPQTGLTMTQARGRVGGAHETFWELFGQFLSEATEDVLLGRLAPADARAVFLKLYHLKQILSRGAGASWLSVVRNDVQYRHAFGVWPPATVNRASRGVLARLAQQWSRDPMEIDVENPPATDLGAFVIASAFIVALCKAMFSRVAERSTAGNLSFARQPLLLCR
jgi:hypothetical protein